MISPPITNIRDTSDSRYSRSYWHCFTTVYRIDMLPKVFGIFRLKFTSKRIRHFNVTKTLALSKDQFKFSTFTLHLVKINTMLRAAMTSPK